MASKKNPLPKFPREVRSRTQRPVTVYTRLPDHYAVHGLRRDRSPAENPVLAMGEGEDRIEIFRGEAEKQNNAPGKIGPVYTLPPGGAPAVPTGRIFIRFKEKIPVEQRLQEIEQAGYEIVQRLEYAPHAAWLQARSGEIADALTDISALERIADVENVEPQMVLQRANR
ncbi:MAG: hypothetical protein WAO55_05170 [Candidatus Manganitrophaceae bacterium]